MFRLVLSRDTSPAEFGEKDGGKPWTASQQPELDVLKLLAAGRSNKEIAAALNTTEGTIKSYVIHILDKLGVSDRTEAVTTAIKRGIIHL